MSSGMEDRHLPASDLAAYLDHTLSASERAAAEQHLAWCDECRSELREVGDALRTFHPARRRLGWIGPAVAAAAVILLVAYPLSQRANEEVPAHRDVPVVIDQRPDLADPAPLPDSVGAQLLQWSRVERADRYRVSIFSEAGSVVWRTETPDTSVALPSSSLDETIGPYLWRVDARVGIDRWVESRLEPLELSGATDSQFGEEEPTP
ncbi:MAG: zf-HC2 domain-containing protein [Gemmatimonadota bacterium]